MAPPRSSCERSNAAYRAMDGIGVPQGTVEPVLERLLKLFDYNWEYIEADNFRALADAIFDVPDPKEDQKRKAELKNPEQEHDNKKLKKKGQCQKPKSEMLDNDRRKLDCAPSEQKTRLLSPYTVSRERTIETPLRSSASGLCMCEPKIEPGDLQVRGIGENCSTIPLGSQDVQPFETPLAAMYPPILDSSPDEDLQNPPGYEYSSERRDSSRNFEVAMPGSGAVKLSFTCSSSLANRSDFRMPDIRSICKEMEERCRRTYKILEPNFSFMNILRDICHCIVDLGSQSVGTREENNLMRLDGTCSASATSGGSQNSSSNMLVQHQLPSDVNKPPHDLNDITKGEESVRIPIVSRAGNEKFPPPFYYIPHNITFQDAYINLSLARIGDENCCSNCFGDCLASPIPCACATETGGEFAYTRNGLIKEGFLDACVSMLQEPNNHQQVYCEVCPIERAENKKNPGPCKGHLIKKFIKECWSKCGCSRKCGNRVVQRGITHNLQVFVTPEGKGWGLRTVDKVPRGAFICEYVGEILTNTELYDRTMEKTGQARHTYPVLLDADWATEGVLKDEEALCLDATFYGNVARFINHRCFDANVIGIPVEVETPDHHYYHLAFFTIRQIEPFEELTWDYGIDFNDIDHPIKAFKCRCRSEYCRDRSRISRSKSRALVIG